MNKGKLYQPLFLGLITILGVITIYAIKQEEAPRFVLFLGRFHPLLLHLPIGALVVTFFIDVLGRFQKTYNPTIISALLGFTSFFAIFTCFLGYFLSLEGGYEGDVLDLHLYTGIGTAAITLLLFWLTLQPEFNRNKLFFPLFIVSLVIISITGHYGSTITHGDKFLTEYATAPQKEKTIEIVDSLKMYNDVVAKIIDNKCIQCHNASKQKGEFSMLTPELLLKGGVKGASIIPGNALASSFFTRTQLPFTDKEHMPPEGKVQLTKDEIWLIKHWIDHGADFKDYVTLTDADDGLETRLEEYLVFDKVIIPKAPLRSIEQVRKAGYRVLEVVPGEGALAVKLLDKAPDEKTINILEEIKDQIVELDFHTIPITNDMSAILQEFKNLTTLKINSTEITDDALKNLYKLERLEVLNLYNTGITNDGLTQLLTAIQPDKIYAWKTEVDRKTATKLALKYNITIENFITDGFVEESRLKTPIATPKQTLFNDKLEISLKSNLRDVTLRYTLDGTDPDDNSYLYEEPIVLKNSQTIKAKAFKKDWQASETFIGEYAKVSTRADSFVFKKKPDERYSEGSKLFDMNEGSLIFNDGNWVGFFGEDLDVTIDLGKDTTVDHLSINCLEDVGSWILFPKQLIVYSSNSPTGNFEKIAMVDISTQGEGGTIALKKIHAPIPKTSARYFKVIVKNHPELPDWHPGAGTPAWLFIDEIYFW